MAGSNEVNLNESKRVVPLNTWVLISNFKLAYNILRRSDGTFNRELAEFLDRKVPANTIQVTGLLNRVYQPAPANEAQWGILELEKPLSTTKIVPVIIFLPWWKLRTFFSQYFCKAVVVSVNYRRAPEHRYPSAYEDGWTALKWVKSRTWLQSGKDSKVHVYLAGDSSGGNIAHHVAVKAAEAEVEVLGNILLHPMFAGKIRTESEKRLDGKYFVTIQDRDWYWRAYLPEGEDRDHPACNPFGPRGISIEGLKFPKSLVVVAGLDLVQDWQLAYVEGLQKAGQEVKLLYLKEATIGFYFLPNNDHFYCLMEEINNFVNPNC
ncbi:hypothetical protein RGQ29_008016 [Quercus rubra]|uniref:Alpha/beta hydrolase fold-3 domain-containing protein n=1 Tax=Quercus rubra TaxID=3512 RepID=A0AAN7DZS9_QUERU|nr:hypothetical protein RGQ29_008016 [Quercus rubra]